VHVGYVDDATAVFKAEGDTLDEAQPGLNEVVCYTAKLTQLIRLSREQYMQVGTPDQLSLSVQRAIIRRADIAFLAEPAPTSPAVAPMAGLLNPTGIVDGGTVATNLDKISDLIAVLEDNLSVPTAIVVDPVCGDGEFPDAFGPHDDVAEPPQRFQADAIARKVGVFACGDEDGSDRGHHGGAVNHDAGVVGHAAVHINRQARTTSAGCRWLGWSEIRKLKVPAPRRVAL
jgi:hypothetical protein